ncbi:uncharacterized protein LOC132270526 [Cornus florida]|uniref:uncharacterized protein LOC132270526 n=1 Tax=Cornus florida TaxID=4283 RepID=UPI00289BD2F8|nr:uncharacterized protein LOC132270526 [Cornus florida]
MDSSNSHFQARSVSLPSRSHLFVPQFDEHLCRVRSSEATSSSSSSSIRKRLSGLEDLYESKWVDEALDGFLRLLDVFGTVRDVLSQTKENVPELLSVLRRRRDANRFGGCLANRKKVIQKSLKDLKSIKNKHASLVAMDKDHVATVSMLKEVEAVTVVVLESLLSYIMGTKVESRSRSWFLVSKLMQQKRIACEDEETDANMFEKVDAALHSLMAHKTRKSIHFENMNIQLGKLESSIQDLEEGIESLFRHLIKTRVSLLNILNH